jgi:hypothetical protein
MAKRSKAKKSKAKKKSSKGSAPARKKKTANKSAKKAARLTPASYLQKIEDFRQLVSAGGANVNVGAIVDLFVPDAPSPPGPATVGLTLGAASPPTGPWFSGRTPITNLFTALNRSFPGLVLTYPNQKRPADGNTVAVEASLDTGAQNADWHPVGAPRSPPISTIAHAPHAKPHGSHNLPVCAIFTFDPTPGSDLIQNLALYFDRYRMAKDLWDGANPRDPWS